MFLGDLDHLARQGFPPYIGAEGTDSTRLACKTAHWRKLRLHAGGKRWVSQSPSYTGLLNMNLSLLNKSLI